LVMLAARVRWPGEKKGVSSMNVSGLMIFRTQIADLN
jgi:hypothetical protein